MFTTNVQSPGDGKCLETSRECAATWISSRRSIGYLCTRSIDGLPRHWPVVPNLWGGVVGDPGALKTPALTAALEPITELEMRARKCHDTEMVRHMADELTHKITRDLLTKQLAAAIKGQTTPAATAATNPAGSTTPQVSQLQAHLAALHPPEPPRLTRYKSNDTTVEKLLELLQDNSRGIGVSRRTRRYVRAV